MHLIRKREKKNKINKLIKEIAQINEFYDERDHFF